MKRISLLLIIIVITLNSCAQQKVKKTSDRLDWWSDAKLGMFLHWGLHSQAAGDWKGHRYKGNEHFMIYEKLSLKEYGTLADDFNPKLYNADQWVKMA